MHRLQGLKRVLERVHDESYSVAATANYPLDAVQAEYSTITKRLQCLTARIGTLSADI